MDIRRRSIVLIPLVRRVTIIPHRMTLPPSDAAGTLLGTRYRLDSLLGVGGMGQVHLAHDTVLERKVAIKMLPADVAEQATARERFRREALAVAALDHPFICKIHEVGEDAGRIFIVMEYVEGRTLDRVTRDGRLSPRQLIDCAHEIAQALDEAHRRGVVHRDLKPSNIMLTVHGHVKVLDFGLAKTGATGAAATPSALGASAAGTTNATGATSAGPDLAATALTDPGTRLGTPAYMSPEQVLGSPLDPRSDIFSLGTVLHEMTGCGHPFLKATAAETMASILRDPPAATTGDLDVVPGFGVVVHRMLAKACAERFQSMGELKAELDLLRDGSGSGTPASGSAAVRAEPAERTPFVARDAELTELTRALDRMLLGHGGIVLLGGEPGVGKTRLAREAQRLARARGCLVLTGQCYEHEGAPPFGPFAESIEQSLRMVPQAVRAVLGDLAPEVAMLAPVLRRVFPDIPPPPVVPADQQRRVMFDAYTEYVRRATQKSAVVLLLDDLHWADESSLQLLLHLAPHLAALRVLAIGTYRDVELDTERPFARTLETLLRQRLATRITVKRLGASGVERMLATMSGAPPPSSLVRVVHEETDGNPFFVEEVFQHLAEEGRLFDEHGHWKADLRPDDIDVPEGVRLVISRRLERLGEDARRILTAAAVIGRSFSLDLLQAIVDASDDAVLDLVEQAERAHLLQAERGRDARYSFVHELIRSTLVSAMSLPRRQRLHAKIADALERLRSVTRDTHISMLAHHLYQAGAAVDAERTIGVLLTAMERSQAAGAFEETLVQVEQLLSLELAAGSAELATVEETRAQALMGLRRLEEALQPASRAFEIWVARRHDAGIHRTAVSLANAAGWSQSLAPGVRVLERALAALSPNALRERAALQTRYGTWIVNSGRLDEAVAAGEAGCRTAEALNDRLLLGDVYAMH
jgi:predicted Ser/Thr protein kinase